MSHSTYGAEILACADDDDMGYASREMIRAMTFNSSARHILHVDSLALSDNISTLHERKEYPLRLTVESIRHSFEGHDVDILRWISTGLNIADSLKKRCPAVQRTINVV